MPVDFSISTLLSIGLGGAIGALSRYGVTMFLSSSFLSLSRGTYCLGTLAVNTLGCFLAGLLLVLKPKLGLSPALIAGLGFGFLGALTTFSTFSTDTMQLIQDQQIVTAIMNILLNLCLCLLFAYLGMLLGQRFVS